MAGLPLTDPFFASASETNPIPVSWDGSLADPAGAVLDHEVYGPRKVRPIPKFGRMFEVTADTNVSVLTHGEVIYLNPSLTTAYQLNGSFFGGAPFKVLDPGEAVGITRLNNGELFIVRWYKNPIGSGIGYDIIDITLTVY